MSNTACALAPRRPQDAPARLPAAGRRRLGVRRTRALHVIRHPLPTRGGAGHAAHAAVLELCARKIRDRALHLDLQRRVWARERVQARLRRQCGQREGRAVRRVSERGRRSLCCPSGRQPTGCTYAKPRRCFCLAKTAGLIPCMPACCVWCSAGDDVGATGIRMRCSNGDVLTGGNEHPAGAFVGWRQCPVGKVVATARLRSHKTPGFAGDDSGGGKSGRGRVWRRVSGGGPMRGGSASALKCVCGLIWGCQPTWLACCDCLPAATNAIMATCNEGTTFAPTLGNEGGLRHILGALGWVKEGACTMHGAACHTVEACSECPDAMHSLAAGDWMQASSCTPPTVVCGFSQQVRGW